MYRYLTLAIACLVASPAFGQERQLAAFSEACLTGLAGFETVEAVAARYDAQLIDVDPPGAVLSPLTLPRADRRAWLGGQPDQKAVTDLSFGISVDAASDKPVVGCAVLGFVEGEPPADDILLGRFVNHRYVGKPRARSGQTIGIGSWRNTPVRRPFSALAGLGAAIASPMRSYWPSTLSTRPLWIESAAPRKSAASRRPAPPGPAYAPGRWPRWWRRSAA